MKPEAVGFDERRLAALTLHALGEDDRNWVLGQMSVSQRGEVQSLLAELESLGIPRDPTLVEAALGRGADAPVLASQPDPAVAVAPDQWARVLSAQPAAVAARCLMLLDDSTRSQVEQLLPEELRRAVTQLGALAPLAPSLRAGLWRVVGEQAANADKPESQP